MNHNDMTSDDTASDDIAQDVINDDDLMDEDFESIGDHHRAAAHHFAAAARHHLAAAKAHDVGEDDRYAQEALLAYRHQLNGVQCAEIAQLEGALMDEDVVEAAAAAATAAD